MDFLSNITTILYYTTDMSCHLDIVYDRPFISVKYHILIDITTSSNI